MDQARLRLAALAGQPVPRVVRGLVVRTVKPAVDRRAAAGQLGVEPRVHLTDERLRIQAAAHARLVGDHDQREAGAAQEPHWPSFAAWLPGLAAQFTVVSPAAWGAQGIAQQNLANSTAFGQQLQEHRAWSQDLQQQVTDQRWRSDERRQHELGEALTGHSWYDDPHGNPPERLSNTPVVQWVHRDGTRRSSDDPSYDPRTPEDPYWERSTALP